MFPQIFEHDPNFLILEAVCVLSTHFSEQLFRMMGVEEEVYADAVVSLGSKTSPPIKTSGIKIPSAWTS